MKRLFCSATLLFLLLHFSAFGLSAAGFTLELSTNGNGTISRNPSSTVYPQNSVVTLTAMPAAAWQFAGWSGDISGALNPTNVLMDGNKSIAANFVATPSYMLAVNISGAGSVAPSGGSYLSNTIVPVTATASNGWVFHHWSGDASGSVNPLNVTMNGNRNITAVFVQPAAITGQPSGGAAAIGSMFTFSVTAVGDAPLAYQWLFNHAAISNATASTLALTNVQPSQGGDYQVIVSNPYGSATSGVAVLTVNCPGTNVVSVATDAALRAAVAIGGDIRLCFSGTVVLTNTIDVVRDATLDASGLSVRIDGNSAVRLFNVNPGVSFTLTNVGLVNGFALGTNTGGAAIFSRGSVRLVSCFLSNNVAKVPADGPTGSKAWGGALRNDGGLLEITGCSLVNNLVTGGSSLTNGPGHMVWGGAIYSTGMLSVVDSSISSNTATNGLSAGQSYGGGIWASVQTSITNTVFAGNRCTAASDGFAGTSVPANLRGGALFVHSGQAFVEGARFVANQCICGSSRNAQFSVAEGGAIFSGGNLQIRGSLLTSNSVLGATGFPIGSDVRGGAICSPGSLVLVASTVAHNVARAGPGRVSSSTFPGGHAFGGGVFVAGPFTATNSTIAQNVGAGGDAGPSPPGAAGSAYGGGCYVTNGTVYLLNVTFAANAAQGGLSSTSPGRGLGANAANSNGVLTVRNSLLALPGTNANVWGIITDGGYNMSSDGSADFGSGTSFNFTDPKLLPLADNGGPTPTMALAPDSPALDWAPAAGAPSTDQRGFPRPYGSGVDVGAFEAGPPVPPLMVARNGNAVNISFLAQAGVSYRMQRSSNLVTWETEERIEMSGANGIITRTYPVTQPMRAYRLALDF